MNSINVVSSGDCSSSRNRCLSRRGCSSAMDHYFRSCGTLLHRETDVCSPECVRALVSLLSPDYGSEHDMMQCDCNGNEFCENVRKRIKSCTQDVINTMKDVHDHTTPISCSLAELICRADSPCLTAIGYYEVHCSKMFIGDKCTKKCNNSLHILYRQPMARKLHTCYCNDGTGEYPELCERIKYNSEHICHLKFQKIPHRHQHNGDRHNDRSHKNKTIEIDKVIINDKKINTKTVASLTKPICSGISLIQYYPSQKSSIESLVWFLLPCMTIELLKYLYSI